ncbi:MAG: 30S ribosomal protein S12 methylthiotransferase RimO [Verrucomicrobia bacterium]|nr:MAG: 30S ribosomal protein S12 methylthiotransferase RimO [Verrucomicrobiota bacterium]
MGPRNMKKTSQPIVVSLVSLGCAKNTVDSERVLGCLATEGFLITGDPTEADICLVNTCGFIHDAREESAATLREISKLRRKGQLKALVALGCLAERALDVPELGATLEPADAVVRFKDYPRLPEICRELAGRARSPNAPESITAKGGYNEFLASPRLRIGATHSAYLKISEGCSNPCRFCSIPRIRGKQISRPIADVVREARELISVGAKELCVIAQDTTSYGRDLAGKFLLPDLLVALRALPDAVWFRLMYAYPLHLSDAVLETLASDPRFCPYLDMPLQHISDAMLAAMGRGMNKVATLALLNRIPQKLPGVALRTSFIVGYPGETDRDFEELLAFVREGRFTHAGVFLYSHEAKTPAAKVADGVPVEVKQARRDTLMAAQLEVARRRQAARVGQTLTVLVDECVDAVSGRIPEKRPEVASTQHAIARSRHEAPEVDGVVLLRSASAKKLQPGSFVTVRVVQGLDYDVVAEVKV